MPLSMFYILVFALFGASYSQTHRFKDRYCDVTLNDQNQRIFNCSFGQSQQDLVDCQFIKFDFKLIITTQNGSYVKIDKIAPGAFKRLLSGILVEKFYFSKFQVTSLDASDFDGLINISEMRIENPISMAPDTFLTLATKSKYFILTILCLKGNPNSSFGEIYLKSNKWRLYTEFCKNKQICEYMSCHNDSEVPILRILPSNETTDLKTHLSSRSCNYVSSCNSKTLFTTKVPKTTVSRVTSSSLDKKHDKTNGPTASKSELFYDSLLLAVFCLTGINSIIIMGILFFLLIWWKRITASNTSTKHTIVLDAEDEAKYLKLNPYN